MSLVPQRLYLRLVLLVSLILVATVVTYSWITCENQTAMYQRALRENAIVLTANLAESSARYLVIGDYAAIEDFLLRSAAVPNTIQLQAVELGGLVLADVTNTGSTRKPFVNPVLNKIPVPLTTETSVGVTGTTLVVWQPIKAGNLLGWIRASYDLGAIKEMRAKIWQNTVILGFVWIIVSMALLLYLLKRPARAVGELSEFARKLVDATGQQITVDPWSAEIEQLGVALNTASQELYRRDCDLIVEQRKLIAAMEEVNRLNAELERRVIARTSELEVSNRELESFCYSVSHDLRAPLRHIDGYSKILLDEYRDLIGEEGAMHLDGVRRSTAKMGDLIDDLLQLSRVTRSELRKATVDISVMAHEIADELSSSAPEREVNFFIEDGIVVNADAHLIRIVMDNLLMNAWKYTAKKPEARIEFGRAFVANKNAIFVRDNGAGFDMQYADKLFGAFQRLHRVEEFEGTGVGLATVLRIISRHGGTVWGEGAVDKGATFYFTLPE